MKGPVDGMQPLPSLRNALALFVALLVMIAVPLLLGCKSDVAVPSEIPVIIDTEPAPVVENLGTGGPFIGVPDKATELLEDAQRANG
jgi:hypothetical protein